MIKRATWFLATSLLFSSVGCTKAKITRAPDGVVRLECPRGMRDCVAQAEKMCNLHDKEAGYTILDGRSNKIVMNKDGQYRSVAETADLEVRCGKDARSEESAIASQFTLPPRSDAEVTPDDTKPAPASAPTTCTKGSTQACVGPGACQGGQSCLADGSGYGACDCGETTPKPSKATNEKLAPAAEKPTVPVPVPDPGAQPVPLK